MQGGEEARQTEPPVGATWVSRAGVYVDRIASAWLIRRFIDPKASFRFVAEADRAAPGELRFDMFEGEYTHEGDRCTFEVLLQRAGRLVSKDQLVERLCEWGEEVSNNAIEVYIHRLRKKIEKGPIRIATVRGLGYCLEKIPA